MPWYFYMVKNKSASQAEIIPSKMKTNIKPQFSITTEITLFQCYICCNFIDMMLSWQPYSDNRYVSLLLFRNVRKKGHLKLTFISNNKWNKKYEF
jgi:hypothetical protein